MEDDEIVKKIMHVMRKAPHGTIYTYEGLEMVLIMAAYDQDISVAFIDDGVYALKKGQNTEGIEMKGFAKTFGALDGYDVEKLYVDQISLEEQLINLLLETVVLKHRPDFFNLGIQSFLSKTVYTQYRPIISFLQP